jgi:hypothetical protein
MRGGFGIRRLMRQDPGSDVTAAGAFLTTFFVRVKGRTPI